MIVARHKKLAFYGVPGTSSNAVTFHRMKNFTTLSQSKNPTEYNRQYVDEPHTQSDVVGYSPSISYSANAYSISIECCHPDWTGKFNDKTYTSLVELCAELLKKYGLTANDLIRHYDVTGKICPKCFVPASKGGSDDDKQTAWKQFKADVEERMADAIRKPAAPVQGSFSPFLVKVTCTALNVRADAGMSHKIKTVVHKNEVYTIVDTKQVGNSTWGKLKSGAGWINIGSAYCKKL